MPLAVIVALISASPAALTAVEKIIADIKASGHPASAPLTPAHIAAITAAVIPSAPTGPPAEAATTKLTDEETWDEDHAGE
jgi:hypothetical protein